MPARRLLASVVGCVFVLGAAGILLMDRDRPGTGAAKTPPRTASSPVPPPAPSPSGGGIPSALPPLPAPVPAAGWTLHGLALPAKAPADERAPSPIIAIGRIEIPSIGISHGIYEGVTLTVVDHGPGHWPGSAMPGDRGNTVFAGHRTVNDRPFHNLDLVKVGDRVVFEVGGRRAAYEVTKNFIVDGTRTDIALPTPDATMTLFACHPKGSAKQRIVVTGKLVSAAPI